MYFESCKAQIQVCRMAASQNKWLRTERHEKKRFAPAVVVPSKIETEGVGWSCNERLRCPVAPRRGSCAAVSNTQFCTQGSPATVSRWSIFRVQLRQNPPPQNRSRPNRPVSFDHLSQDRRGDVPGAAQDQHSWCRLASVRHRPVGRGPRWLSRRQ